MEYTSRALNAIWCENSIVELDEALSEIEHRVEDVAKSSNDALNEGFWLGVLFGLFIDKSSVFNREDNNEGSACTIR